MRTLYSIQYLRAFAALAVVVFHAAERTGLHFVIGAAGVHVFFVISGFIMAAISADRPASPKDFFRNRLLRIAPAYWAATLAMLLGGAVGLFPNLKIELAHTLGSFLFVPVHSPSGDGLAPLLVQGWTLNYEMFFYAVFALVLFLKPSARFPALALAFSVLVLSGLWWRPENPIVGFYTSPLILEFVAGAALAKLWQRGKLPPAFIGILLVCLSLAGFAAIQIFRLRFDAWTLGPLATLLVFGALAIEVRGKLPAVPTLGYLGESSYSIYLWHTFAISIVAKVGLALGVPSLLLLLVATVCGTFAGIVGYECLERPVQQFLKGHRSGLWRIPMRGRTALQVEGK
ncbi:MAG: acyltransferase [Rhizobiaceae bacterium]|nr:acyltransferase [Rhizobiaceae bacterium]